MQKKLKFILCKEYNFEGNEGISCKCYDPSSQKIVSVKTSRVLKNVFGDEITVNVELNGNYVTYIAC